MAGLTARGQAGTFGQRFQVVSGLPVSKIKIVKDGQQQFTQRFQSEPVCLIDPILVIPDAAAQFCCDFQTPRRRGQ